MSAADWVVLALIASSVLWAYFLRRNAKAHTHLGWELGNKGDWDGEIAEEREALHLNPNNGKAHYLLGMALERKSNYEEALGEYRTAHELNPQNPAFRTGYERLLKRGNH